MENQSIHIDLWLYGPLSEYCPEPHDPGYANIILPLPAGGTMQDLLSALDLPSEKRGITFINGNLSAMPGLQPDLDIRLNDGDRVAMFHLNSMWPFQYRHDAAMTSDMAHALQNRKDFGIHHNYSNSE